MLENPATETDPETTARTETPAETPSGDAPAKKTAAKKTAAKKTAAEKTAAKKTVAKKSTTKKAASSGTKRAATKKVAAAAIVEPPSDAPVTGVDLGAEQPSGLGEPPATAKAAAQPATARKAAAKKTTTRKAVSSTARKAADAALGASTTDPAEVSAVVPADTAAATSPAAPGDTETSRAKRATPPAATAMLFQSPDPSKAAPRRKKAAPKPDLEADASPDVAASVDTRPGSGPDGLAGQLSRQDDKQPGRKNDQRQAEDQDARSAQVDESQDQDSDEDEGEQGGNRRRRRRGGRRRRKSGENGSDSDADSGDEQDESGDDSATRGGGSDGSEGPDGSGASDEESTTSRRRRRRRRTGDDGDTATDDPANTVTRVRKPRAAEDEITALVGSTRLEAKKQRRREGREAGRRRAPIASEAEFLARREAVDRVMVIRQKKDLTQIAVLEDKVLVEHYVARESQTSLIGNVYIGRVQNVLPSMEAAFIDIGMGRNAVLYAGEVNWGALGAKHGGQRKIEQVLKSGQSVLVQVTKDPIGHKGARLTSQISLPGRFLVYVPDGTTSGISRKLPDTERNRLKTLLKEIVPDSAGVIVRTAAEGASEDELTRDVERLTARWDDIESKLENGNAPQLLYGEPDLTLKVVRDLFTEDFAKLVVSGDEAWDMVDEYVKHIAPDLEERLEKYDGGQDVFAAYRIDEQIAKGLDRKVWLPSGGSLVIDRTEAMTVVDVNTGKFTGSGGNLEETVTKNNLEAAEEIVRQLRLRDIGGIIVVDFIDMVLESNRDLVLRRMVECLGRDRTRHQVAEVTSLGLVQMTRKRIGTGLLEAFSETCEHCQGRGLIVHHEPIEPKRKGDDEPRRGRRNGRGRGRDADYDDNGAQPAPTPNDVAAMAKTDRPGGAPEDRKVEQRSGRRPNGEPGEQEARGEPVTGAGEGAGEGTGDGGKVADEVPAVKRTTRTRGGRARREAGPATAVQQPQVDEPGPVGGTDETAHDAVAAEPAATGPVAEERHDAGAGTTHAPAERVEPAAPKIVTAVRRRGAARRPAGPPPGTAGAPHATNGTSSDGVAANEPGEAAPVSGADAGTSGGGTSDGGTSDGGATGVAADVRDSLAPAHVPVKKRGSGKH